MSDEHTSLITAMIKWYGENGYTNICADHVDGYEIPNEVSGQTPDISCNIQVTRCINEAETSESIETQETIDQLKVFAGYCSRTGTEFHVIVPKKSIEVAKQIASNNGVKVDHWFWL